MTEKEYWFWICNIPEIYQTQIKKMLDLFETPENAFKASDKTIRKIQFLNDKEIENIISSRKDSEILRKFDSLKEDNIDFIYFEDPRFPVQLKNISDTPFSLYLRGNLPNPKKYSVGMVGARKCSGYGKEIALKFSKNLASRDIQIISGMASGIDSFSSKGAIEAGGKTFVVLGTGVDVIYPLENIELYYQIIESGGGIISEFPPGTRGIAWNFPHRNRIISGLSDKLLIIEARKQSGTLTTAQHALNQNVDIYAVPGRITDKLSEGCNRLIADGCGVMINLEDFLYDLYSKPPKAEYVNDNFGAGKLLNNVKKNSTNGLMCKNEKENSFSLPAEQSLILSKLNFMPTSFDALTESTNLSFNEIQIALAELELIGLVEEVSKDVFVRVN